MSKEAQGNLREFRVGEKTPNENKTISAKHNVRPSAAKATTPTFSASQNILSRQFKYPKVEASSEKINSKNATWSNLSEFTEDPVETELLDLWNRDIESEIQSSSVEITQAPIKVSSQESQESAYIEKDMVEAAPAPQKSSNPQSWPIELALEERKMEREGFVDVNSPLSQRDFMKKKTLEFMAVLHENFRKHVEIFNDARRSPAHSIQIYRISNTQEDFMLFRNGVKLLVSGQNSGRVLFAFNQYMGQMFAPSQGAQYEIEAALGPLNILYWSYKGERVQVIDLVRFFITEFSRQSTK